MHWLAFVVVFIKNSLVGSGLSDRLYILGLPPATHTYEQKLKYKKFSASQGSDGAWQPGNVKM